MGNHTELHFFGGLGGRKYIKTMERIIDLLPYEADAQSHTHRMWMSVANGIISRFKKHGQPRVMVLGGHSYGALRVTQVADKLDLHGIEIDYIFGIDPTLLFPGTPPMYVPGNVALADEFHASRGIVQAGRRSNHGGKWLYPPSFDGEKTLTKVIGGHSMIAESPTVTGMIREEIETLLER